MKLCDTHSKPKSCGVSRGSFALSEAKKIERQRQLDLLFLAGPKDFHPGEAQGASMASTMSVKLGVGVSQGRANIIGERAKHVPDKE